MATADQDEIKGYEAYAFQDEAALVGAPISSVAVFASTSANWLGDQECHFWSDGSPSCVQFYQDQYANGFSTAQGGPGGIFLYWAAPNFGNGPASNKQKTIAHELFHVLQYQLDRLLTNGSTPSSQVRPSGPVWLDEGSPEVVGYRVASDRGLFPSYASELANRIQHAKQIGVPLSSLETLDQTKGIADVYSLFLVAVDHLVSITPSGLPSLATYLNGLGAGMAWRDAFKTAFGMSVEAYYVNFAAYRAGL